MPPLPHAFSGTVTIDGDDAVAGTVVSATINGEAAGSYTTTVVGQYGDVATRDYLAVSSANTNDGDTITFYVNGISTGQTDTFETGGGPTVMNLVLVITDDSTTGEVVEPVAAGSTDHVVDASDLADTTITVSTTAQVTVTVEKYYSNPHPTAALPANMLPRYIDISVDNPAGVVWPMHVEQTYTDAEVAGLNESTLAMYYYKAADSAWHVCSDTGVNTVTNTIWANMTQAETAGSPVGIGGAAAVIGGGGGGGGGMVTLNLIGLVATQPLVVNSSGIVQSTCQLKTADGKLTLDITAGTRLLDYALNPLPSVSAALEPSPSAPPSGQAIILAYNLGPARATFSPQITLTIIYDLASLPEGVAEQGLYIAYWDGSKWNSLATTVNVEANTVSCQPSHFTVFAVIGAVAPPPGIHLLTAALSVSNLSIQPAEAEPEEAVTITVSVANTGGTEGSYTVVLDINGVKEAEKSITVAAGGSESVSFSVTREEVGSYTVAVDGLSSSFTVVAPAPPAPPAPPVKPPINWFLAGGIIAGALLLIGLLVFLLCREKRA